MDELWVDTEVAERLLCSTPPFRRNPETGSPKETIIDHQHTEGHVIHQLSDSRRTH